MWTSFSCAQTIVLHVTWVTVQPMFAHWDLLPIQGSDQFMNWIGIDNQFNSIQHELNWNWIERLWIRIELELNAWTDRNWSIQSIHFQFNSPFYKVKHLFVCHFMEIVVWQAIPCKQAYPHAPLCVPSMGSAGVFWHKGITITSITLRYFQCFNSLVMKSWWPRKIINSLVPCNATLHQIIVY